MTYPFVYPPSPPPSSPGPTNASDTRGDQESHDCVVRRKHMRCKEVAPRLGPTHEHLAATIRLTALRADQRACLGAAHATAALRQKYPRTTRRWMTTLGRRGQMHA